MIDKMHDYLLKELGQSKQIDTVFLLTGIIFNLIMLAINAAAQSSKDYSFMIIFSALSILITLITVTILIKGKDSQIKMTKGLLLMYEDNNIGKYFDKSILKNDSIRNKMQVIGVILTCVTAVVIPIILKVVYKGNS